VLFLLLFLSAVSTARPVRQSRARRAAAGFLDLEKHRRHKRSQRAERISGRAGAARSVDRKQRNVKTIFGKGDTGPLAYIVELEPEGFVVVSADDSIGPIVACSNKGRFPTLDSEDNLPLKMLRCDIKTHLEMMRSSQKSVEAVSTANIEQWDLLEYGDSDVLEQVAAETYKQWPGGDDDGWLDTAWHQGSTSGDSVYNASCPPDPITPSNKCVAGCVAIALAQVVNYFEYPSSVVFSDSDNYLSRNELFEPERLIWIDLNPDGQNEFPTVFQYEYDPSMWYINYNENGVHPSNQTISDLIFGCGVLTEMDYSDEGSGTSSTNIATALIDGLGYDSADIMEPGVDSEFYDVLRSNMKNGQPAIISIRIDDSEVGHAVVCDGYRDNGMYHLNYGWGSQDPCEVSRMWYSLSGVLPAGYNTIKRSIVNIHPDGSTAGSLCSESLVDFARFARQWQQVGFPLEADLSGDEDVDYEDLELFSEQWLQPCYILN
jgi:hypothetical protein